MLALNGNLASAFSPVLIDSPYLQAVAAIVAVPWVTWEPDPPGQLWIPSLPPNCCAGISRFGIHRKLWELMSSSLVVLIQKYVVL